jgi:hypothetical protein
MERERIAERTYGATCVILVINDNPYGLMVELSYLYYWFRVGGEATHSTYNM